MHVQIIDYILHLDVHLAEMIQMCGIWIYVVMGLVVFVETAFVVTVFLPSDSLIFAAMALSAVNGALNAPIMAVMFFICAAAGDSVNFMFGRKLRGYVERKQKLLFLKKKNLEKAEEFYKKDGNLALIVSRFIPILRSLAPFTAGMSDRTYKKFFQFNIIGIFIWNLFFCSLGYFLGNLPFVKKYFALIVLGIALLTLVTAFISMMLKKLFESRKSQ